jgi:hypothetical protein
MLALWIPQRNTGGVRTGGAFLDQTRLAPGDGLDASLSAELCCSACMVVLYTPMYFDRDALWCAREYQGMLALDGQRRDLLSAEMQAKSLIISVVIRGEEDLPPTLRDNVVTSFADDLLRKEDFKTKSIARRMQKIAKEVYLRYSALKRLGDAVNCTGFAIPGEPATRDWLAQNVAAVSRPMPGTGGS